MRRAGSNAARTIRDFQLLMCHQRHISTFPISLSSEEQSLVVAFVQQYQFPPPVQSNVSFPTSMRKISRCEDHDITIEWAVLPHCNQLTISP
jgi:hypothetical protein